MQDAEAARIATEQKSDLEKTIVTLRTTLLTELTPATEPITPKVAFKLLLHRETLSWRTLELAEGSLKTLNSGNFLSAIILTRALLECSASYHFFCKKLNECVKKNSVESLDSAAMKLIIGARWADWEYQATNVLTFIDGADKECPGIRANYDSLSEFVHPNYSGTLMIFSDRKGEYDLQLGRYPRGTGRLAWTITNGMDGALMLFQYYYNQSADILPKVMELCARDLEQKQ